MGLPPAVCLIVTMVVRGALSVLTNVAAASVASLDLSAAEEIEFENLRRLAAIYAIIFVGTVPATILAAFARGLLWSIVKAIWRSDPTQVTRVEKVLNSALRIFAVLGGALLIGGGRSG